MNVVITRVIHARMKRSPRVSDYPSGLTELSSMVATSFFVQKVLSTDCFGHPSDVNPRELIVITSVQDSLNIHTEKRYCNCWSAHTGM